MRTIIYIVADTHTHTLHLYMMRDNYLIMKIKIGQMQFDNKSQLYAKLLDLMPFANYANFYAVYVHEYVYTFIHFAPCTPILYKKENRSCLCKNSSIPTYASARRMAPPLLLILFHIRILCQYASRTFTACSLVATAATLIDFSMGI